MTKRLIAIAMILCLGLPVLSGCYQTGKAAGSVVKESKEGAKDMKEGYKDGKAGN